VIESGWTKRWRKRWGKKLHNTPRGCQLMVFMDFLIDEAAWEPGRIYKDRVGMVEFNRGDVITTTVDLAKEFGVDRQTIRTFINKLAESEFLTSKTTNRITHISITNYSTYQDSSTQDNQQTNQLPPKNKPATNQQTNQPLLVKKKEVKKRETPYNPPTGLELKNNGHQWVDPQAIDDFIRHRIDIKKPLTALAFKKSLELLEKNKGSQREMVDTTIRNSWIGLFPPKFQSKSDPQNKPGPRHKVFDPEKDFAEMRRREQERWKKDEAKK
jgi:hypothetical protein